MRFNPDNYRKHVDEMVSSLAEWEADLVKTYAGLVELRLRGGNWSGLDGSIDRVGARFGFTPAMEAAMAEVRCLEERSRK